MNAVYHINDLMTPILTIRVQIHIIWQSFLTSRYWDSVGGAPATSPICVIYESAAPVIFAGHLIVHNSSHMTQCGYKCQRFHYGWIQRSETLRIFAVIYQPEK